MTPALAVGANQPPPRKLLDDLVHAAEGRLSLAEVAARNDTTEAELSELIQSGELAREIDAVAAGARLSGAGVVAKAGALQLRALALLEDKLGPDLTVKQLLDVLNTLRALVPRADDGPPSTGTNVIINLSGPMPSPAVFGGPVIDLEPPEGSS